MKDGEEKSDFLGGRVFIAGFIICPWEARTESRFVRQQRSRVFFSLIHTHTLLFLHGFVLEGLHHTCLVFCFEIMLVQFLHFLLIMFSQTTRGCVEFHNACLVSR